MTGGQRYIEAIARARKRNEELYKQFIAGEIDVLPCSESDEKREIVAEMEAMQKEIDRQREILQRLGMNGAAQQGLANWCGRGLIL